MGVTSSGRSGAAMTRSIEGVQLIGDARAGVVDDLE